MTSVKTPKTVKCTVGSDYAKCSDFRIDVTDHGCAVIARVDSMYRDGEWVAIGHDMGVHTSETGRDAYRWINEQVAWTKKTVNERRRWNS